jgi:hypothetical protein
LLQSFIGEVLLAYHLKAFNPFHAALESTHHSKASSAILIHVVLLRLWYAIPVDLKS